MLQNGQVRCLGSVKEVLFKETTLSKGEIELAEAPPLKLAMTMLGVRNLAASCAFYSERLGLPQTGRIADFVFFDAGGATICLSGEKRPPNDEPLDVPVELVLSVQSVADAHRRLQSRGVAFTSEPHEIGGGMHVAHFRDPDGHLFSLYGQL
jgi:catechol 2,3-dioxygenase-like lactoylglutathione lyase family enzyme